MFCLKVVDISLILEEVVYSCFQQGDTYQEVSYSYLFLVVHQKRLQCYLFNFKFLIDNLQGKNKNEMMHFYIMMLGETWDL